jgi:hypothetical protein
MVLKSLCDKAAMELCRRLQAEDMGYNTQDDLLRRYQSLRASIHAIDTAPEIEQDGPPQIKAPAQASASTAISSTEEPEAPLMQQMEQELTQTLSE